MIKSLHFRSTFTVPYLFIHACLNTGAFYRSCANNPTLSWSWACWSWCVLCATSYITVMQFCRVKHQIQPKGYLCLSSHLTQTAAVNTQFLRVLFERKFNLHHFNRLQCCLWKAGYCIQLAIVKRKWLFIWVIFSCRSFGV